MLHSSIHQLIGFSAPVCRRHLSSVTAHIHGSQASSLTDSLIEVDKADRVIGPVPKLDSHLAGEIQSGLIHRAFSVFLFSRDTSSLLIQKRSPHKIVFPREWANTCCSHPLYTESEMENADGNQIGIKRAATKRLNAELGTQNFPVSNLSFKEKILYSQLSPGGTFGESECDYILVGSIDRASHRVVPHSDEVEEIVWIEPGPSGDRTRSLRAYLGEQKARGFPPTPWFDLMVREKECLELWWSQFIENPDAFLAAEDVNEGIIRNFLRE